MFKRVWKKVPIFIQPRETSAYTWFCLKILYMYVYGSSMTIYWNAVYEVYRKVPGLDQKRNADLNDSILAAVPSKLSPLERIQRSHRFSTLQKHRGSLFLIAVECRLRFHLDASHCFKPSSLHFHFQFGKEVKSQGANSSEYGGWRTIPMLLVIKSVVFRDVWVGVLSWWRSNAEQVQIFC
jgi:hypothetical protein